MIFLLVSFLAGMLTVFAPCILPVLPVIIGSSLSGRGKSTPFVVVGSLAVSVIVFTYLLKVSTLFVQVPPEFWKYLSGGIFIIFGITLLFPGLWESIPGMARLSIGGNKLVGSGYKKKSFYGDVLIGAALGPIFSTCSPTYFVILASVLPTSLFLGTLYILSYTLGFSIVLLLVAFLGDKFAARLSGYADSKSSFRKWLGVLFLVLGLLVATGYEKKLESAILNTGFLDITKLEQRLLRETDPNENVEEGTNTEQVKVSNPYKEIVNPSGFVNTEKITLGELVGKKIILVDFLTYSCINCQRTFPYLNAWYKKYKDQGLEIVGIHTPEFAFERDIDNVREAMEGFGIMYPIVLDNTYSTWNAYGNQYWPRKYIINIHGDIVYDHIGEGGYEETEMKIRELLEERAEFLKQAVVEDENMAVDNIPKIINQAYSPETYFGSLRNTLFQNGNQNRNGVQTPILPVTILPNKLYLSGTWAITGEYAESLSNSRVVYKYTAKEVYIVAESDNMSDIEVFQDGVLIQTVSIKDSRLYVLIKNAEAGEHTLELKVKRSGVRLYAFTFG